MYLLGGEFIIMFVVLLLVVLVFFFVGVIVVVFGWVFLGFEEIWNELFVVVIVGVVFE